MRKCDGEEGGTIVGRWRTGISVKKLSTSNFFAEKNGLVAKLVLNMLFVDTTAVGSAADAAEPAKRAANMSCQKREGVVQSRNRRRLFWQNPPKKTVTPECFLPRVFFDSEECIVLSKKTGCQKKICQKKPRYRADSVSIRIRIRNRAGASSIS